jgi:hypothetical protein
MLYAVAPAGYAAQSITLHATLLLAAPAAAQLPSKLRCCDSAASAVLLLTRCTALTTLRNITLHCFFYQHTIRPTDATVALLLIDSSTEKSGMQDTRYRIQGAGDALKAYREIRSKVFGCVYMYNANVDWACDLCCAMCLYVSVAVLADLCMSVISCILC